MSGTIVTRTRLILSKFGFGAHCGVGVSSVQIEMCGARTRIHLILDTRTPPTRSQ